MFGDIINILINKELFDKDDYMFLDGIREKLKGFNDTQAEEFTEKIIEQLELQNRIIELNQAYYSGDISLVSDAEWDEMYDRLNALEDESGVSPSNSPISNVGSVPRAGFRRVEHRERLWSLDKAQTKEQIRDWKARVDKLLLEYVGEKKLQFSLEYKFDGLTINLSYDGGKLVEAATRGNGMHGESVIEQAKTIKSAPKTIEFAGSVDVQGECIMRLSTLEEYNKTADEPLKNARNAAAGALRNLDTKVVAKRKLDAFFL